MDELPVFTGRVSAGNRLGRRLGFPTANLTVDASALAHTGVWAAWVTLDGTDYPAVVNLGTRPSVGGRTPLLEAHLLDFAGDLYGRTIQVRLKAYLRPERKFDTLDALTAQIERDRSAARQLLKTR